MGISNLTRNVLEATVGDYVEKGYGVAKDSSKYLYNKVKDFDVDRYNAGKSPYPTKLERAREIAAGIKDEIRDRITQNPRTAIALGTAGAIGTGYGAYRYIKSKNAGKKSK